MLHKLDRLESRIRAAMLDIDTRWKSVGRSDAAWTRAIKNAVGTVGENLGYSVCAAGSNYRANGEWLYDMTWLGVRGGVVVDIPLALESEWTPDEELMYDFQKLVVSRARHRVMVFWQRSNAAARRQLKGFERQVRRYRGTRVGDRYLFAFYVGDTQPIRFMGYVAS